jgi:hypothetical protein
MTTPTLSILIPTTPDRKNDVEKLLECISRQYYLPQTSHWEDKGLSAKRYWGRLSQVEVVVFADDRVMTIGEKRELLYKEANAPFSWQIDSDDLIADNAIELIFAAIASNPLIPCITFKESCMINGVYKSSNHSIRYSQWMDNQDGYAYVRSPFYKDVIRTDIAKSVPFERIRWNEDERWSMALLPLLTDEIHIDQELYYYIYNETNSTERYGLDK